MVINGALVLVVTANQLRDGERLDPVAAICQAGGRRFRPILLTSLTTFFGLMPMIFETSMQARFLIPMAISIGFGILFSTAIILLLIPAGYLILEDLKRLPRLLSAPAPQPRSAAVPPAADIPPAEGAPQPAPQPD